MSVSLLIEWPDGRRQDVAVAGQGSATSTWAGLGKELGLKWIPRFYEWIPVNPANLSEVIAELEVFRDAAEKKGEKWDHIRSTAQRLIDALRPLADATGWEASIG